MTDTPDTIRNKVFTALDNLCAMFGPEKVTKMAINPSIGQQIGLLSDMPLLHKGHWVYVVWDPRVKPDDIWVTN